MHSDIRFYNYALLAPELFEQTIVVSTYQTSLVLENNENNYMEKAVLVSSPTTFLSESVRRFRKIPLFCFCLQTTNFAREIQKQ
jgi:hypothetical protein